MKILITGVCGFAGSHLAIALAERIENARIAGIDNLLRPGSELNRAILRKVGVRFVHGDLRLRSDVDGLPDCDWVIDAAANPSVLAGIDGRSSSRQIGEHNLGGTINVLEYCRERNAGLILLSSSRVYSIADLSALPVTVRAGAYALDIKAPLPAGVSCAGVNESFSTAPPVSLYGATKLCSEVLALEYGAAFGFPVWVNRCGNLAGAGQFGTAEQGIFSYWIHAHERRARLRYIGFGGHGHQVRDALHPADLAELIARQMQRSSAPIESAIYNAGGGASNAMSLAQLTAWCDDRFGAHTPESDLQPRPFDIPWMVMNPKRAADEFGWTPERPLTAILQEIAVHAELNPRWAELCEAS